MNFPGTPDKRWFEVENPESVNSPSLLIYADRVEQNLTRMISVAGHVNKIRPHVKTHKMSGIIHLMIKRGVFKFKCATISEAEMVAACGANDILLACQPVGPNIERYFNLIRNFPGTKFSCIADCENIIRQLSESAAERSLEAGIWLDINNGMNRTGVAPGEKALRLYRLASSLPSLVVEGLHVYDGHIHVADPGVRKRMCDDAYATVESLISRLEISGFSRIKVVAGGSPTFPFHAARPGVDTSPGTIILWDYGYSSSFPEMGFVHAAALLTRVISKPSEDIICLDLGHKAVASEMPHPRVMIPGVRDFEVLHHNEEHLAIKSGVFRKLDTGDHIYAIPVHICPTVDRYDTVAVVRSGKVTEEWDVDARKRKISV